MDIVLDPNIVYLLLVGALALTAIAIFNPGTGVLEILAFFMLIVAGGGVFVLADRGGINWWALLAILVGMILFIVSVRRPKQVALLAAAIVLIVIGSVYLFASETWYIPSVNPYLAIIVSVCMGGFFWFAALKVIEASSVRPTHDLEGLVGQVGEAKTDIHADGSAQVAGELWSVFSDEPIADGQPVRVINRHGFALKVEAVAGDGVKDE